ncbi:hypothetical protein OAQ99_00560 [Candidatus Kapabacteria bacterium]|nr:hypothetical protein [Candidatus Kapabacteria bacterium]
MKYLILIIIIVLSSYIFAQDEKPAILEIRNTNPIEPSILEFDIYMRRNSNLWQRFANGTYYFEFKKSYPEQPDYIINPDNLNFTFQDVTTELALSTQGQNIDGLSEYIVNTQVINEALVVSIIGPEDYVNAQEVPLNTSGEEDLKIGTFRVQAVDSRASIPTKIRWKTPAPYWQTTAYKNDIDRDYKKVPENEYSNPQDFNAVRTFFISDNINLNNPNSEIEYSEDFTEPDGIKPRYVDAKYFGDGRITVSWKTDSEIFPHNYVIKRMKKNFYTTREEFASLRQYFETDLAQDYYAINPITSGPNARPEYTNQYKVVATGTSYDRTDAFDIFFWDENTLSNGNFNRDDLLSESLKELLTGVGNETPYPSLVKRFDTQKETKGEDYFWTDPEKFEKGEWGCYHVSYQDWNGFVYPLGYDCEQIPNSVIAFANAYPNPFETETQIDFELLDDVKNLQLRVVDGLGKVVTHAVGLDGVILDNVSAPDVADNNSKPSRYALRGTHTAKINIPKSSLGQASYSLLITADPLNDNFVGSSNALVKLQVTR